MKNLIFIIVVTLIVSFLFIGCSADMVDSEGREWYKMESLKVTFSSEDAGIEEVKWNDDNGKGFRSKWKKSFLHIQENEEEDYIMIMKTKEILHVMEADIELSYKGGVIQGTYKNVNCWS
jgi:hypothetical protein